MTDPRVEGRSCWCGRGELAPYSETYRLCRGCKTLVATRISAGQTRVSDEEKDLYGLNYFVDHARALGHPDVFQRTRLDLSERCVYWLEALLRRRPPPARTLELGAASGAFVALLATAGYDATGLDLSPAVTELARTTFDVPILTGPLEEQRLAPGSLDVLILMDVLEHLPDPERTLAEAARVLRPDGLLLVQTPRFEPDLSFEQMRERQPAFVDQLKPDEHLFLLSRESATELMARAGFAHVLFEPAIFSEYDMFFVASRAPIPEVPEDAWRGALRRSRPGRVVEALVDAFDAAHTQAPSTPDHVVLARKLEAAQQERDFWKRYAGEIDADRNSWVGHAKHWKARAEALAPLEPEVLALRWIAAHPAVLTAARPAATPGDLPLVSIVTPTLNQGRTIRETLESVAAQTYPRIEHIVVDGASTDETLRILESAPGVRWISEKDRGQADAINKGLRMAKGEIVAYVNSDDLLYPDAVSIAVEAFLAEPDVDFLYGDGTVIDEGGKPLWEWLSRPEDWRLLTGYFFLWNDFTNWIMQPASFWRRSLGERVGLFDEGFHFAMDVEFWIRVGSSGARMKHVPQRLAKFRMADGTKTLSSPTAFWADHLELFRRHHGAAHMRRYVEQYLFQEMAKTGCTIDEARARYERIAAKRWSGIPEGAALLELGTAAVPGALVRLADDAWNTGDARRARAVFREALARSRSALLHPRALVLLAKLLSGPLAPRVRRLWSRGIERYRDRRYQYRYREAARREALEA
ncbi:glycosyltransferase [Anaeromyxobacter oryzae]|uniref:Glycosyltransferase 2-like domain-containing protein n=1 Tax=Anaeromyxobacter oryzae TaxID=2918170 RepID=A0ABM7X257_9BACT|nr:glycosyltransferase [Anaeromyxobacter oryzae]BDG05824.1 hypothetical protein AMOR_48200 [Anaeromyxobacter oryzae]